MTGIMLVITWAALVRRDVQEARSPAAFQGWHGRLVFVQEGDRLILQKSWLLGRRIAPNLEEASRLQKVVVRWFLVIAAVSLAPRSFFPHLGFIVEVGVLVLLAALMLCIHRETRGWARL